MLHDKEYFFQCFRMSPTRFEELLKLVAPMITKETTRLHEPIGPGERLAVTLRYCVTGDAQRTIAASYRMEPTTVSRIVSETCESIWVVLKSMGFF